MEYFASMRQHVLGQGGLESSAEVTLIALVRLLSSMLVHVDGQVGLNSSAEVTLIALVRRWSQNFHTG